MSISLIIILCIVYNVWYNNYKDKQKRGIQLNLEKMKMKMEARKRMKILGIHEPTIAQFVEEGKISFSGKSYLGANYWINEERKKAIEIIEKENNILVYYAIEQKYVGDITMLYLFYISPYEEDWEMDHQSIVENYQYTYGLNETDPFLSEFGEIKFKNMFGGLVKQ
ncbi:PcfR [Enterococcus faecalis]